MGPFENQEKAVERISFRAGRGERDEVTRRAGLERRSVSQWIRIRIQRALEAEVAPVPYPPSPDRSPA